MTGYLLDTNVLSETRKKRANDGVIAFLSAADPATTFVSVLTIGELHKGIELKRATDASGAKKLREWAESLEHAFGSRVLPISLDVAMKWGQLAAAYPSPVIDTLIAATALEHDLTLVTRNVADVRKTGVMVLDPWIR